LALAKEETNSNIFSDWLEKLQQESWQLELLISGFVLFGLAQSYDYIISFGQIVTESPLVGEMSFVAEFFVLLLWYAWRIFFINLIIHVVLRGLWIGTIGLRYVSGDIDFDVLNYSDVFVKYFKKKLGSFDNYIERLEKISSLIFAYTFLLFFIFLSAFFSIIALMLFIKAENLVEVKFHDYVILNFAFDTLIFLFLISGIFVLFDFLTLGGLKRIKGGWFPKVYLRIYSFFSLITLSRIYRPILYNFIDDKYTKKFFIFSVPYFLCITVFLDGFIVYRHNYLPTFTETNSEQFIENNYYDDLRSQKKSLSPLTRDNEITDISLSSIDVASNHLKIFLPFDRFRDGKYLKEKFGLFPYTPKGIRHVLNKKKKVDTAWIKEVDDPRTDELVSFFREMKNDRASRDSLTWESDLALLEEKWENAETEYYKEKSEQVKEKLTKLFSFKIDTIDYNGRVYFKYGKHQHRDEVGFHARIYFDSLSLGEHILHFERKRYSSSSPDSLSITKIALPFYKN